MGKSELISAIRLLNHSATQDFLQKFSERDLQAYLDRMRKATAIYWAPWFVPPKPALSFR